MQRPCIWEARGAALEGWIKPERGERTWSWSGRTLWAPGKPAETLSSPPPPIRALPSSGPRVLILIMGTRAGMQRGTQQNRRAAASLLGLVPRGEPLPALSRMEAGGKLAGSLSPDPWKNKSSLLAPPPPEQRGRRPPRHVSLSQARIRDNCEGPGRWEGTDLRPGGQGESWHCMGWWPRKHLACGPPMPGTEQQAIQ